MDSVLYLLVFTMGFLLSGLWFGCQFALATVIMNKKIWRLDMFKPLITGIIPTVIICLWGNYNILSFERALVPSLWGIALLTVMVTSSIIIVGADRKNEKNIHKLFPRCVEAACMEIPQRAMMQSFTEVVLIYFGLNGFISIWITALIWCAAQCVQLLLFKQKATKTFWIEMIASFVFSLGIGYSFWASKFIPMTMLCHGIERFVTNTIDKA